MPLLVLDPIARSPWRTPPTATSARLAALQDFGPQLQTAGVVHAQHLDSSAPGRANAIDACAFKSKVVGPSITPRMKEGRHFPGPRVDSCQVRAFVQIAAVAS
jgi:hypothetical protein